jgi:hypothetical protein
LYLLTFAVLAGLVVGTWLALLPVPHEPVLIWAGGMFTAKAAILLTYVEVAGVWFFSRQRGWRVPLAHAERVCCYAAPGWMIAAGLMLPVIYLLETAPVRPGLWWLQGQAKAGYLLGTALAVLAYECFVYLGARQIKYANRR